MSVITVSEKVELSRVDQVANGLHTDNFVKCTQSYARNKAVPIEVSDTL